MALSPLRFQGEAARPDRLAQVDDDARPAATQLATAYGAHGGRPAAARRALRAIARRRSRINRSGAAGKRFDNAAAVQFQHQAPAFRGIPGPGLADSYIGAGGQERLEGQAGEQALQETTALHRRNTRLQGSVLANTLYYNIQAISRPCLPFFEFSMNALTLPDIARPDHHRRSSPGLGRHAGHRPSRADRRAEGRRRSRCRCQPGRPAGRGIHMSRLYLALAELEQGELDLSCLRAVLQRFLDSHAGLSRRAYLRLRLARCCGVRRWSAR